ncbi:MAG: dihydrodipicolinate synthase family protein [Chloroflexi bacterium]|nr:dihydrodipicolinate synthase family protein [Chloroflexota bacterium]
MSAQLKLSGLIPPMITPLTPEGEIDITAIGRLVGYMVSAGVDGIFVFGSSGEGPWLSARQRRQALEATVQACAGRVPVLAGILEPSAGRVLEELPLIEAAGVDAIVITSPYYFGADGAVQLEHFSTIAQATTLPIVLYNIPQTTYNLVLPATVRRLLEIDTVIGIKDSAEIWENFEALLEMRRYKPGFTVLQGAEPLAAKSLLAGGDGLIPGLGNVVPQLLKRLLASVQAGDQPAVLDLQQEINHVGTLHSQGSWLPCLKYAASLFGFGSGRACYRSETLSEAGKAAIRDLVQPYIPASPEV